MSRKYVTKIISSLLTMMLCFCLISISDVKAAYTEANIGTYEQELAKFPSSYKPKIQALHNIYPNAIFVAQDKFFDYSVYREVAVDWNRMLSSEHTSNGRSLVYETLSGKSTDGYRATDSWAYSYYNNTFTKFDNGKWYAANPATISYYMDPRNFLDERYVFMFESHLYNQYQTLSGIEKILSGTFMGDRYCPGTTKKYSEVIMEAAQKNDVSAYMLASRLRQEQGTAGTSSLISGTYSGYEGYYNYFNVSASGNSSTAIITSGLKYAKSQGWNSAYNSIIGGAAFIKTEYVGINDKYNVKGQLTGYLQKWDPYGYKLGGHQYMQNITAHYTEASTTYNSYASTNGYKNYRYIFYIPVYSNMPASTSLPNIGNPNNWLSNLTVNGATVSGFNRSNESYSINVSDLTNQVVVDYTRVANTSSATGRGTINLTGKTTTVNIVVTAGNGAKKTYVLKINKNSSAGIAVSEIVNASGIKSNGSYLSGISIGTNANTLKSKFQKVSSAASITIKNSSGQVKTNNISTGDIITIVSGNETKNYNAVIYGDVNGDGSIKASDYVFIKNKIMGTKYLSGAYLSAADVNKDGKVTAADYVLIKNSIMGSYTIRQ